MKESCFVSGALATVLRVFRLAGLAPLIFVREQNGWRVSVSPVINYLGYILILIIYACSVSGIIKDLSMYHKEFQLKSNLTQSIVWYIDYVVELFIIYLAISGSRRNMKCMITCLNYLEKINDDLYNHGWPYWLEKKKIIFFVITMMAIITISVTEKAASFVVATDEFTDYYYVSVLYSFYYISYWIMKLQEIQFIMITLHVLHTYKKINDNLRSILQEMLEGNESILLPWINKSHINTPRERFNALPFTITATSSILPDDCVKSSAEKIRVLAWHCLTTCDVVREINRNYGVLLLLILGFYLFHLVKTPFYFLNTIFASNDAQYIAKNVYIVLQFLWCLVHATSLIAIVEPCHMTQMEMEETRFLVSHMMCAQHSAYEPLAVQLELFYKQLVLNHAAYEPLSVINLSRSLVATMFGSVTTYLLLIMEL